MMQEQEEHSSMRLKNDEPVLGRAADFVGAKLCINGSHVESSIQTQSYDRSRLSKDCLSIQRGERSMRGKPSARARMGYSRLGRAILGCWGGG